MSHNVLCTSNYYIIKRNKTFCHHKFSSLPGILLHKEVWNWREEKAEGSKTKKVKYTMHRDKDVVVGGKVEINEKEKMFCLSYRTEKKVL